MNRSILWCGLGGEGAVRGNPTARTQRASGMRETSLPRHQHRLPKVLVDRDRRPCSSVSGASGRTFICSGPERRPQAAGPASWSRPNCVVLSRGVPQMSIHSIQIDQSMQNWQVSGGSAYWFRCIPNRLGCIATFLISKAPRSCVAQLHENGWR